MCEYPECEKVKSVKDKSDTISEFIDWLNSQDIHLCIWKEYKENDEVIKKGWELINESYEILLQRFFKIDGQKWEKEKLQILQKIRDKK